MRRVTSAEKVTQRSPEAVTQPEKKHSRRVQVRLTQPKRVQRSTPEGTGPAAIVVDGAALACPGVDGDQTSAVLHVDVRLVLATPTCKQNAVCKAQLR